MPQSQYLRLGMPMGGLYRRLSYQSHPPYTTASCSNVRPDDTLAQRERLGMRPDDRSGWQSTYTGQRSHAYCG
jgi:hypothetical protein